MAGWHRTWRGDLGLRAMGLGACALSYASIAQVMHLHDADPLRWIPGSAAYLLTAIGFLCGSAGVAMMLLGSHLFDEIAISERWQTRPSTQLTRKDASGDAEFLTPADVARQSSPSADAFPIPAAAAARAGRH